MPKVLDLKAQARALSEKLTAKEAELKEGKASLKKLLVEAGEDGSIGTKEFNDGFEAASKPIDALAEETEEIRRSHGLILLELGEGGSEAPFSAEGRARHDESSWGERFVSSDVYKNLVKSGRLDQRDAPIGQTDGVTMTKGVNEVKALLTTAAWPLAPDRQPDVVRMPLETITILDLISIGDTTTEIVEWVRQKTRTSQAGSVAEGAAALESTYEWEIVQEQVEEIAHFHASTKRAMRDEGQMRTLVDQELVDGLRVELQSQIISGDGETNHLTGLYNTEDIGSYERNAAVDDYLADAVHRAITTVRIATKGGDEPTAVGMHPNDWQEHRLAKDEQKRYINGDSSTTGPATMWGLRPIVHVAFPEGNPMVGNFKKAKLWIWSDVALSMTDAHEDYFIKRLVAVMASFGGAFGVMNPLSFCEVTDEVC